MDCPVFERWCSSGDHLVWLPHKGVGYLNVPDERDPYLGGDDALEKWKHYQRIAQTEMGKKLTAFRVGWVESHLGSRNGRLLDLGIGSGKFIYTWNVMGGTGEGFDVNPHGIAWLKANGLMHKPGSAKLDVITMWDVLEHLRNPAEWLDRVRTNGWVFTTIPLMLSGNHAIRSKHYKPREHRWYWTWEGLVEYMGEHGFSLRGTSRYEQILGRHEVRTFAFLRETAPRNRTSLSVDGAHGRKWVGVPR